METQSSVQQGPSGVPLQPPPLQRYFDDHPVVRNRARLPTPPIKAVFDVVSRTVFQRDPGCSFIAHPRFGKTFAIRLLSQQLGYTYPDVPVIIVNAKGHPRFSELTYYTEILENCKHSLSSLGKGHVRRSRLVNYLWTLAQAKNSDRIVLFIDEAQNWSESELSCLRDISNDLSMLEVALIAISFGQTELAAIRTVLLQSKRTDLIGRFMMQQYEFLGLISLSDLVETMECYDKVDISEYPEGSGVSYTEYFLPMAFRSGWRLANEAGRLWEQFRLAAKDHGGLQQVGMHWVAACIKNFLVTQIPLDRAGFHGVDEDWKRAVFDSHFEVSLGVTYDPTVQLPVTPSTQTIQ